MTNWVIWIMGNIHGIGRIMTKNALGKSFSGWHIIESMQG